MTYFKPCDHCGKQHAKMLRCPNLKVETGVALVGPMPFPPSTTNLEGWGRVVQSPVDTSKAVDTEHNVSTPPKGNRHKLGYKTEYMRKWRAAAKAKK